MRERKQGFTLFLLGLFFILISLPFQFWLGESKSWEGEAEGVIYSVDSHVETHTRKTSSGRRRRQESYVTYTPSVEFYTNGIRYSFRSSTSSTSYENSEGRTVTVIYDKEDPSKAQIKSDAIIWWILPWIFTGSGIIMCIWGMKVLIFGVKRAMTIDERYGYR